MKATLCSALAVSALLACTDTSSAARDASLAGDSGQGAVDERDAQVPGEPGRRIVTFTASDETFLSPERGFYTTTNLATVRDLGYVRDEGKTLVYAAVHLDAYLGADHEQDLPASLFTDVQAGFDAVRAAGLKAIVRFQYDDGEGYPSGANDASEASMTRHIAQLAPLLAANEDVLFLLQAGLIGAWGEWHTSQNFVDGPDGEEPRARIVQALLEAVPASRRIALRYPAYKRMFYGEAPCTAQELRDGVGSARVGHLNDCFVSSEDDVGTYQYEPQEVLESYLEQDTLITPIGGETCAEHPRNACDVTLAELTRFHWTYLNDDYHPGVLARWQDEGCRPEIERRLGYRLWLESIELPERLAAGDTMRLALKFMNDGFSAATNTRPVRLVLEAGASRHVIEVEDARIQSWGAGLTTLAAEVTLPASVAKGEYALLLWLPDAAPSLAARPEYALRLANAGLWRAQTGDHLLTTVRVE